MKIIFDSEEEKEEFLDWVCLGDISLKANAFCDTYESCKDCWKNCSDFIEMEVKE